MKLSPMRYKNFVWPHNPKVYEMSYKRSVTPVKLPFGGWIMQDMGKTYRVLTGEGEFVGKNAYAQFKKLAEVFEQGGTGVLMHPVWQMTKAIFVSLTLAEEPRENYVKYTFEFWEDAEKTGAFKVIPKVDQSQQNSAAAGTARSYTVVKGDTMWGIAARNNMSLTRLIALNPQIKNPNLIYPGNIIWLSEGTK